MKPPQRGELYWANLDPAIGSEIAKTRPALIISNRTLDKPRLGQPIGTLSAERMEEVNRAIRISLAV